MDALVVLVLVLAAAGRGAQGQVLGRATQFQQQADETLEGDGPDDQIRSSPVLRTPTREPPREDLCITPAYPTLGLNSDWNNVKWISPPARCTVRGFPIEDLQQAFNFRRGYALGYTDFVEDKTHLLPYLRASADLSLHARQRRVLLDLGGSYFETSVLWFLRMYPLQFSDIFVFEASKNKFKLPEPSNRRFNILGSLDSGSKVTSDDRSFIPNAVLDRIHLIEKYVGMTDYAGSEGQPPVVNITRFIKDELQLTPDDTVIIKMDIEGLEWQVLPAWMEDPQMSDIIDEIFVEVHYSDPTMEKFGWNRYKAHSRDEAVQLFMKLREKGFFIHAWP